MSRTLTRHRLGFLLVSASAVAWSLGGLFTRLIPLDSWTVLAWRGLFGALGLAAAMTVTRQRDVVGSICRLGWRGWGFVVQTAIGMILYITALKYTTVAHVAIIYATAPFMSAGLGWLALREMPSRSSLIASVIALCGVVGMMGFSRGGFWGELAAFGTTASMAVTMVVARNYPDIQIMPAACLSSLLSGIVCWFFATPLLVTRQELLLLATFGVVNFSIGLPLFTRGRPAPAGHRDSAHRGGGRAAGAALGLAGVRRGTVLEYPRWRLRGVRRSGCSSRSERSKSSQRLKSPEYRSAVPSSQG